MSSIDWNELAGQLISHIPPFEVRLSLIAVIVLLLAIMNAEALLNRRKRPILDEKTKRKLNPILEKIAGGKQEKKIRTSRIPFFHNSRRILILNIIGTATCLIIVSSMLFVRPFVIRTTPEAGSTISDALQEIAVEFDLPIDKNEVTFNISPEVKGEWTFESASTAIKVERKAVFHPEESFYPGNPVIIYITGIQSLSRVGKFHEQAISFKAPKVPTLRKMTPADGAENVKTDAEIILEYDAPIGNFVETTVEIEPAVEFNLKTEGKIQKILFHEALAQDSHYAIRVFQTPRSFNAKTGERIEVGETTEVGKTSFSTVTTPGIASYEPKGEAVAVTSPIIITFNQEMERKSVERHFAIDPNVNGTIIWKGNDTFTFTPDEPLPKETIFTLTFSKGMRSFTEGMTKEDIILSFTTIGRVKVISVTPVPSSYGVDPISANISIEFDQPVDQLSAQQHVSISPAVSASPRWNENTLTLVTAGNLAFATTYTIVVSPGIISLGGIDSTETFTYQFSTRSNTFALNIPLYLQAPGFTCNLVATKMVLQYRGISVDIETIKNTIGVGDDPNTSWVNNYGTHWGPISRYINQYRPTAAKTGWTLHEILIEVQNGNPVILFWYNRYSQPPGAFTLPSGATGYMGMHSEVVRGFVGTPDNPSAILTNDPWRGQLSYSPQLFINTWAYINNAAVVVY